VGQLNNRAEIHVTGITEDETWYRIEYEDADDDTAWVFATLTSATQPVVVVPNTNSGGSSGSEGNSGGETGANTSNTNTDPYFIDPNDPYSTCDMSICSAYPILRRCDDHTMDPWAALDARQIACCWRGRDGDHDGVACFGN
jgi:hypothetical protein